MDAQDIFDKVCNHLLSQGERSLGTDGLCRYRGEDGFKCAVGAVIPDRLYLPEFERNNVIRLLKWYADKLPRWFKTHRKLLLDLQLLHDNTAPCHWKQALLDLGESYGLQIPPVLED